MATAFSHPYGGALHPYYLSSSPVVLTPDPDSPDIRSLVSEGDVLLRHTADDGEIEFRQGVAVMQGGLETAVYLSLFGGNEDDPGGSDETHTWWGNVGETRTVEQYRSRTQHLLQSLPPTSANLRRFEGAAAQDLGWLITEKAATKIEVFASVTNINTVHLAVAITAEGQTSVFDFAENWKART